VNTNQSFSAAICLEQVRMAEAEFSAFYSAVKESFGEDQARLSAEDWLDESRLVDSPERSTGREWRAATIAASIQLAKRLAAASHLNRSLTTTDKDKKGSPRPSSDCFAATLLA
jgi:hypothetical protein